ncbi:sodium-coupled monocarboxylate transporter 1 isoform X2 [Alosa sapidissima]|uniref:sodium-coupled monocarboxylate transporter 1 isoform X2 n=1 Tax=Alosa sapidissima TaxID=34773 RepID=UPI001C097C7B|nr:sodium-coupled monocarboxylate transporter 1 isoform X2 [Alosa sapidissima]
MDASSPIGFFSVWDYAVFALMLLVSAAIGVFYAYVDHGPQSSGDFLMAGRSMTAVPVAMSLSASFMSAIMVLSTPAEIYRFGALYCYYGLSFVLTVLVCSEVFVPVYYRLGITSTYEYLEMRFNRAARLCGTALFVLQTILYTGIVIYVPALALNQVTGFDLWGAVIATGVVCTFYCTLGGLKAVVWTDVLQVGIMVAGLLAVILKSVVRQGGMATILNDAAEGGRLEIWESLYVNLIGLWVILLCSVLAGLCLYSVYKHCDPWTSGSVSSADQLMPYLVMDILREHPGLPGLFVAAAYSGTLSTVSSSINALAAVTVEDLVKPYSNLTEKQLSRLSKALSLVYGALCIGMAGLASIVDSLLQVAASIFGVVGGPLLGLFMLGILCPFANATGGLAGLFCGLVLSLWVGIGAQLYPPMPSLSRPLALATYGCNGTVGILLNSTISASVSASSLPLGNFSSDLLNANHSSPALVDSWYSVSYLYFSPIGTLTALAVGVIVSLLAGNRKCKSSAGLTLCKEDLTLYCLLRLLKEKVTPSAGKLDLSRESEVKEKFGQHNPAFCTVELSTTSYGKTQGPST